MNNYEKVAVVVSFLFFIVVMGLGGLLWYLRADPGFVLGIGAFGAMVTLVIFVCKTRFPSKRPRYDVFE